MNLPFAFEVSKGLLSSKQTPFKTVNGKQLVYSNASLKVKLIPQHFNTSLGLNIKT